MHDHHLSSAGFKITISSSAANETSKDEVTVNLNQLGEQVTRFIGTQLNPEKELTLNLRIEHWDEVFSVEESALNVRQNPGETSTQDYTRNYWI
ncbi:hypothetical protein KXD93_06765 [Mucilaginibacter sp. BJC16-A38]|uniref:hypothetical protein n=1 Tax=Mucilaginibacter phenanthrenivorans TaxID=1234842 RepID=UPI00215817FF|nr:hypothetical protein [Mucilaginibacter phenanthrenivorans]MCR8557335.1 hypothetical protein [Mucilaginibacter phenanthrenivorans]